MRAVFAAACLFVLAACGSSTDPSKAGDPSLLITNNLDSTWVYITWRDGAVIEGRDSVPPRTASQCVRFLAQPDSAYWDVRVQVNTIVTTQTYPYFNPADRPAWRVVVYDKAGSPGPVSILTTLVDTPC
jgi:hypothetical protein